MFERATLNDRQALLALMKDFYREDHLVFDEAVASPALERLLAGASFGDVYVLREGGMLSGYFVTTWGFSLEFGGKLLLLDELYLSPHVRGKGLARKIFSFLDERAKETGCHYLRLEVHMANERAVGAYRKAGFSSDERMLMSRCVVE